MIVDVHTHFVSPNAIDMARRKPDTYRIRVNDMDHAIQLRQIDMQSRYQVLSAQNDGSQVSLGRG